VESALLIAGVILERAAITAGFLAAVIAIGGFLARALAVLRADPEPAELRRATIVGSLIGFAFGIGVVVVDAALG
jgi:hypothetical protein